jgi:hypothetical protein
MRVVPDAPPSVAWRKPGDDLFLITTAAVPFSLVVKDDLDIRDVGFVYGRDDRNAAASKPNAAAPKRVELFHGPERAATSEGEMRVIDYEWSLGSVGLSPGSQLTLRGEADDYRPGSGQTASPRRVTIITIEQLDARLTELQAQIVRRLEQVLAAQRSTRAEVGRVAIAQRDVGTLSQSDCRAESAARTGGTHGCQRRRSGPGRFSAG